MTTKTDYEEALDLRTKYIPLRRGIVSDAESRTISEVLELENRTMIELRNIRNTVVMVYGQLVDSAREENKMDDVMRLLDAMSGAACVIDSRLMTMEHAECAENARSCEIRI